jgi:hypothetical protein
MGWGCLFGDFFHKLIWSPCPQSSVKVGRKDATEKKSREEEEEKKRAKYFPAVFVTNQRN